MLILYAHGSPNPHKVSIALEELELTYRIEPVNVHTGAQFAPQFLALSPNGKVPVLVDDERDVTIYESNAILLYLAERTGWLFPTEGAERWEGLQLLFLQSASIGPMFGQRAHFSLFAPDKPTYAVDRYLAEGSRLEAVLETLLADRDYFLNSGYSIVDIAMFGWVNTAVQMGFGLDAVPLLSAWYDRVRMRPAVARGVLVPTALPDFSPYRSNVGTKA